MPDILAPVVVIALVVLVFAGLWKTFAKAGKPGWAAIVPFYNTWVLLEIVGRPGWWLILYFIPIVGLIIGIIVLVELAKSFGKGVGYALGLIFLSPIFIVMLGFGSARYVGPDAQADA